MEVKRLILLVALLVVIMILASSSASAVSDGDTSPTYSDISNNEIATNETQAGNSSSRATITITMYTGDDEQFSTLTSRADIFALIGKRS